jgi:hypothetical protein
MLSLAQRHYQDLVKTLFELTGIPVALTLNGSQEASAHELSSILQKESAYQQESLKLLEKAIEVFGEEQELADQLTLVRKDLLEIKKRMKHFSTAHPAEKHDFAKVEKSAEKSESHAPIPTSTLSKN